MRLTLLVTIFFPPLLGGVEHYWREVAERWPTGKLIVFTNPHSLANALDQKANYSIIRQPIFAWSKVRPSWLPLIWKITRIIRKQRIQTVLFGHYANYAIIGLILKWIFKVPYRVMTHGIDTMIPRRTRLGRWALKLTLKNAERVYCNSQSTFRSLSKLNMTGLKLSVAPPGIDPKRYSITDKNEAKRRLGLSGRFVILTVARLINLKGVDLVIRALARLSNLKNLSYLIVGDGPERTKLTGLVSDLKLDDYVKFIGEIKDDDADKSRYYNAADLFVLTTRPVNDHVESFGIVFLEAGLYCLPVIASHSGGASELIIHNQTGLLINPDSVPELVQAINQLSVDTAFAISLGQRLREHIKSHYRWDQTLDVLTDGT